MKNISTLLILAISAYIIYPPLIFLLASVYNPFVSLIDSRVLNILFVAIVLIIAYFVDRKDIITTTSNMNTLKINPVYLLVKKIVGWIFLGFSATFYIFTLIMALTVKDSSSSFVTPEALTIVMIIFGSFWALLGWLVLKEASKQSTLAKSQN